MMSYTTQYKGHYIHENFVDKIGFDYLVRLNNEKSNRNY